MDGFNLIPSRPVTPPEHVILDWQRRIDEARNAGKMMDEVPRVPTSGLPGYELTPSGIKYGKRQQAD